MVRTRFRVEINEPTADGVSISLNPVSGEGMGDENALLFAGTPQGGIAFHGVKPEIAKLFENHRHFYVDFVPVETTPAEARAMEAAAS